MKITKLNSIIVLAAALFASCTEQADVDMHTTINSDGSCTRIVSYNSVMSKEMRDSLWTDSTKRKAQPVPECLEIKGYSYQLTTVGSGDKVTTTLDHRYDNVAQMTEDMPLQLNGQQLQAKSTFEKRFRWFYTEYTFTEVFACISDNFKLPVTDYADDEIVGFWFTGYPNLLEGLSGAEAADEINRIEPSISKWLQDNIFQLNFEFIVNHYDSIVNPPVSLSQFVERRSELEEYIMQSGDILLADHRKLFKDFFHSDAFAVFFTDTPSGKELERANVKLLNIFNLSASYTITMPGRIIDAGTGYCQNDTVFYQLTGERLIPHDYTITATSRDVNTWPNIVTMLAVIVLIVYSIRRKK